MHDPIAIVGAGLAGCECAHALSRFGLPSVLYEMKPLRYSPAHVSPGPAELVCSNSFRSMEPTTGVGLLKEEMRALGSLVMDAAEATRLPAGKALAVDRERFSRAVEQALDADPNITLVRKEITSLDAPEITDARRAVVAAGPLASEPLAASLAECVGETSLYFYDAIAPIVSRESVDMDTAFYGSRWRPEDDDYLNCPMDENQYNRLVSELKSAEKVAPRGFEQEFHFEGCLPVEEMAERGDMTLAFGPLRPVGLEDPRTGSRPFAVLQLRAENADKTAFNMVGFQTKLTYPEQKRVFRLIPGLEDAEFLRLGSIHRNTYVNAPDALDQHLTLKCRPNIHLAGQITGVEGYVESAACGLWLGIVLGCLETGRPLPPLPPETALGGLMNHLRTPPLPKKRFTPSNAHFGLMPELGVRAGKKKRKELYAKRAQEAFAAWLEEFGAGEG